MTKSSSDGTVKTYATFSIVGDQLDPAEVARILMIEPHLAYAKGEKYWAGERSGMLTGKTGVWYLSTDKIITSPRLTDHIVALFSAVALDHFEEMLKEREAARHQSGRVRTTTAFRLMGRLAKLSYLLRTKSLTATLSCFWHGASGAKPPSIPRAVSSIFKYVPIAIETDFDTDGQSEPTPVKIRA